ncbi:MAG: DNA polymerase ligase N-terminal domain-containing protein [Nanoarchaeota archaeon]|nr:DNA polymerase ligase N-terminal domain-containing protein [Nanoarchaeota archaeon]
MDKKRRFYIQKHDATNLHYDFRLEMGKTLKSWAVPKGPSLNPKVKRLAIETADHDLKYGNFEGVIPEGNYGAGTVMLWDRGIYKNESDFEMKKAYRKGELKFHLYGKKLKGSFALIKTKREKQWLLIKAKDEFADTTKDILKANTKSVKSGLNLKEIKAK